MGGDSGRPGALPVLRTEPEDGLGHAAGIADAGSFPARFGGKGLKTQKRSGAEQRQARKLRLFLVARQGGRCHFCRREMTAISGPPPLTGTDATVEHLNPRALGGALCPQNCVAACHDCNRHRNCVAMKRTSLRYRLRHFLRCLSGRADVIRQAIEARRAATSGAVEDESAVPARDAASQSIPNPTSDKAG